MYKVFYYFRIYFKLQLLHIRTNLEYEADFWIGIIGTLLTHLSGVIFVWTLFDHIPVIEGWNLWEILFLYALVTIPRGLVELLCDGQWRLRLLVNLGDFDRILIRPISPALQVVTQYTSIHGLGGVILGCYILIIASSRLNYSWNVSNITFMILTLASSFILIGSINFLTNCIAFWNPGTKGAFPFLVIQFAEFTKYPITVYGSLVRFLITWIIPFAFISYYPGSILLGKSLRYPLLGYGAPFASLIILCVTAIIWRRGIARYHGVGH